MCLHMYNIADVLYVKYIQVVTLTSVVFPSHVVSLGLLVSLAASASQISLSPACSSPAQRASVIVSPVSVSSIEVVSTAALGP